MILAFCSSEMGTLSRSATFCGVGTSLSSMGAVELGLERECSSELLGSFWAASDRRHALRWSARSSSVWAAREREIFTLLSFALEGEPTRGGMLGMVGCGARRGVDVLEAAAWALRGREEPWLSGWSLEEARWKGGCGVEGIVAVGGGGGGDRSGVIRSGADRRSRLRQPPSVVVGRGPCGECSSERCSSVRFSLEDGCVYASWRVRVSSSVRMSSVRSGRQGWLSMDRNDIKAARVLCRSAWPPLLLRNLRCVPPSSLHSSLVSPGQVPACHCISIPSAIACRACAPCPPACSRLGPCWRVLAGSRRELPCLPGWVGPSGAPSATCPPAACRVALREMRRGGPRMGGWMDGSVGTVSQRGNIG